MLSLSATHESLLLASDVNLLKTQVHLIRFCIKFRQLSESVALFHNFKFDTVCHNVSNESLELIRKKRQHGFRRLKIGQKTD